MKEQYYPAQFGNHSFHCPICGVYAMQNWKTSLQRESTGIFQIDNLQFAICTHCNGRSIWLDQKMIFPTSGGVEMPNNDLPQDILVDYLEARDILNRSPRGSAALLRLAIQKLCKELGEKGENLNDDIASLVRKGLDLKIQKALDYVRVVGNNAVHPGQIEFTDNSDTAFSLFSLINIIVDTMISQPRQIDKLYNSLPENKIKSIELRDKKNNM